MIKEMFTIGDFGRASAVAVVLLIAIVPVMAINIRRFQRPGGDPMTAPIGVVAPGRPGHGRSSSARASRGSAESADPSHDHRPDGGLADPDDRPARQLVPAHGRLSTTRAGGPSSSARAAELRQLRARAGPEQHRVGVHQQPVHHHPGHHHPGLRRRVRGVRVRLDDIPGTERAVRGRRRAAGRPAPDDPDPDPAALRTRGSQHSRDVPGGLARPYRVRAAVRDLPAPQLHGRPAAGRSSSRPRSTGRAP